MAPSLVELSTVAKRPVAAAGATCAVIVFFEAIGGYLIRKIIAIAIAIAIDV